MNVKMMETEKDISLIAGFLLANNRIFLGDSREFLLDVVPELAREFESMENVEWDSEDYLAEIDLYAEKKLVELYGVDGQ